MGTWTCERIHGGTGAGQVRRITSNTATTITVTPDWGTNPDNTSQYEIINTSTWTQINDVANDNTSGDGEIKTTWNMQ